MSTLIVTLLALLKQFVNIVQTNVTRYLIKNNIASTEIPFWRWFSWEFIKQIGLKGIFSLLVIASFTLVTFPLGIWVGSFSVGLSLPILSMITGITGLIAIPLQFYTLSRTVHEIQFNRHTIFGLALVEMGSIIGIIGFFYIYLGNKG